MRKPTTTAALPPHGELVLSRILDAPRELVWRAWTDPGHVARWWRGGEVTARVDEREPLPDGPWRTVMVGPDGSVVSHCELTALGEKTRLTVEIHPGALAVDRSS